MHSTSPPCVLAVEDNPETQLLLKYLLEEDVALTISSGVEEALGAIEKASAENCSYDALLLDINLGEKRTGTDLLHLIREREESYTPAIALTAYAMPGDEERFLREGFDQYVGKPFTHQELTEALEQIMEVS